MPAAKAEPKGLLSAVLAVQSAGVTLVKNASNPHFQSRFADLSEVVEKIGPHLAENGLVWIVKPSYDEHTGEPTIKYRMAHVPSGEDDAGEMKLFAKADAQGQGSGITYARRYALVAYLNLIADDDDGNAASPQQSSYGRKPAAKPAPDPEHVANVKRLVRKHGVKAGELRKLIAGTGVVVDGGNVIDLVDALTPEQATELAEFIEGKPTGESDVPGAEGDDFKHPAEPEDLLGPS